MGEYVKFKEMPAENSDSANKATTDYVVEQQITDVEWEEIN